MSQHIFTQTLGTQTYEIQVGWDRPTQEYYGQILGWVASHNNNQSGYFDDLVWCSLSSGPLSLEAIAEEITGRGFTLPDGLLDNVRNDRYHNAANVMRFYRTVGPSVECQLELNFG